MVNRKLLISLSVLVSLVVGLGVAYAQQSISLQLLGKFPHSESHGVYRLYDGPNICYVAKGVESISIHCMKR